MVSSLHPLLVGMVNQPGTSSLRDTGKLTENYAMVMICPLCYATFLDLAVLVRHQNLPVETLQQDHNSAQGDKDSWKKNVVLRNNRARKKKNDTSV